MTAIDLMIIAMTIYAIWRCQLIGPSKRPSAPQIGLRLIALGLVVVCMFYFVDLMSMYVFPVVMPAEDAMVFMGTLHHNLSWLVVLFAMIVISVGFIELRRTQIELTEKNELLAQLSSKLAKFLPPPIVQFDIHWNAYRPSYGKAEETDDLLFGHRQFHGDYR